jgi:hypothetical protein
MKLLDEGNYEQIIFFLENLLQGNKFVTHNTLSMGFQDCFKNLIRYISTRAIDLQKQVKHFLYIFFLINFVG